MANRNHVVAFLCGALFFPVSPLFAQYHIDSWKTDSGLPHNSVCDIIQTRDGYLWLATADGLVRFDGVRFVTFRRENSPGMTENRITALSQDQNGDLWIGSDDSVMSLHDGSFSGYTRQDGVASGLVTAISLDPSGDPLFLSAGRVMRLRHGRAETLHIGSFPHSPVGLPVTHYPKRSGFWSQSTDALEVYIHGRLMSWDIRQGNPPFRIRAVAEDEHGTVWAAAIGKLFRDQNRRLVRVPIPSGCSPQEDIGFIARPELQVVCYAPNAPLVTSSPGGSNQEILTHSLPASLDLHTPIFMKTARAFSGLEPATQACGGFAGRL